LGRSKKTSSSSGQFDLCIFLVIFLGNDVGNGAN
jgi:hypothetical protein